MSVTINGTNGLVFADNSTQATAASGFGFKNRIINGDFRIDQRNAGAAVTASGSYPVDRFAVLNSSTATFSAQQSTDAPAGFISSVKYTVTSADSSLVTTENSAFIQNIEGFNVADFGFGTASAATITLSFWVKSSVTGTFGGAFQNVNNDRSYPFTYSISSANTWEQKSVTVVGDTTGTWATGNTAGLRVYLALGAGPDRSGTAGAWASAQYRSATGATNLLATNGATFYITGVQLEKGSTATSFDYRPYGTELQLCQRYYEKSFDMSVAPASGAYEPENRHAVAYGTSNSRSTAGLFKVTKRAVPTMTIYTPTNYGGLSAGNVAAIYVGGTWYAATSSTVVTSETSYYWEATRSAAYTTGYAYLCAASWAATAEL